MGEADRKFTASDAYAVRVLDESRTRMTKLFGVLGGAMTAELISELMDEVGAIKAGDHSKEAIVRAVKADAAIVGILTMVEEMEAEGG